jgi:hypothetical protein
VTLLGCEEGIGGGFFLGGEVNDGEVRKCAVCEQRIRPGENSGWAQRAAAITTTT